MAPKQKERVDLRWRAGLPAESAEQLNGLSTRTGFTPAQLLTFAFEGLSHAESPIARYVRAYRPVWSGRLRISSFDVAPHSVAQLEAFCADVKRSRGQVLATVIDYLARELGNIGGGGGRRRSSAHPGTVEALRRLIDIPVIPARPAPPKPDAPLPGQLTLGEKA